MGEFFSRPASHPELLATRLASRLRSYREWRDVEPLSGASIREVLPLWDVPSRVDIAESIQLRTFGTWHVQIHADGEPVHYARCAFRAREPSWRVDWIGESWLATAVDRGLGILDGLEAAFDGTSEIRLVSSRRYRFTAFWIVSGDSFLVVSAGNDNLVGDDPVSRESLWQRLLLSEGAEGWFR